MSTSASTTAGATKPAEPKKAEKATASGPKMMLVLDTTATEGQRVHEQIVDGAIRQFKFDVGVPLSLPEAIALKFLKHDAFWLLDDKGQRIKFENAPRQPDQLGAGEKFKLGENETVARYDELTKLALLHRVAVMIGGEKFAAMAKPDRAGMIDFIKASAAALKKANTVNEREAALPAELIDDDGFDADDADEAEAA